MAPSATGPTTPNFGLPTLSTGADAPDGIGINNIVTAIDTAMATLIPKSLGTTVGDLLYFSGASTPARLGIGTTGQALTVSGGLPTWAAAGSYTLLWDSIDAAVALPAASVTTSALPGTYKHLVIEYIVENSSGAQNFQFRVNGDSGTNYFYENVQGAGAGVTSAATSASTSHFLGISGTAEPCAGTARIFNYAGASAFSKHFVAQSFCQNDGGGVQKMWSVGGMWNSSVAITTLTFLHAAGNIVAGSRISVYGVS